MRFLAKAGLLLGELRWWIFHLLQGHFSNQITKPVLLTVMVLDFQALGYGGCGYETGFSMPVPSAEVRNVSKGIRCDRQTKWVKVQDVTRLELESPQTHANFAFCSQSELNVGATWSHMEP